MVLPVYQDFVAAPPPHPHFFVHHQKQKKVNRNKTKSMIKETFEPRFVSPQHEQLQVLIDFLKNEIINMLVINIHQVLITCQKHQMTYIIQTSEQPEELLSCTGESPQAQGSSGTHFRSLEQEGESEVPSLTLHNVGFLPSANYAKYTLIFFVRRGNEKGQKPHNPQNNMRVSK